MRKSSAANAILVAVVIAVLLGGLVAAQQDQNTNSNMNQNSNMNSNKSASKGNTNTSGLSSSDQKFMMGAAMAGMEEVELGRLAATRASSDGVKQFAQRMVDDHSKANDELMQIASTKGVTLPTALDDKHKADIAKMSQLSGADFDRAYVKEAGVKDHNKAVKLFQGEADKGKDADVKAFAAKTLPTIQEHLRMAQEMDNSMRGSKSAAGGNANMSGNSNMSGDSHKSKNKNSNMSNSNTSNSNMSNSNSNTSDNSNMSNANMSNSNTSDNSNMSNSNTSNSNMSNSNSNTSDNSNMSNSNTTNANGNSNTTNANGNSNTPR